MQIRRQHVALEWTRPDVAGWGRACLPLLCLNTLWADKLAATSHPPPSRAACSIILVLGGLLVQLYFGSSLPVSPYPGARERRVAARQRAAQRGSRVTPDQPPPPPAVLATR